MADLSYSVDLLEGLGSSLSGLAGSMKDDSAIAALGIDDLCCSRVVDAVQSFRDDWDDKRELLATKVDNVGTLASEAARTFTEADQDLADQVKDILEDAS